MGQKTEIYHLIKHKNIRNKENRKNLYCDQYN